MRVAVVSAIVALTGCGGGGGSVHSLQSFADRSAAVQRQMQNLIDKGLAYGGIVCVTSPQGSFSMGFGTSDRNHTVPTDPNMAFRCASVTKTFTVALALKMAEDNLLNLDSFVSDYYPDTPNAGHMTIRMLCNMTAGLFEVSKDKTFQNVFAADPEQEWTPDELMNRVDGHKPYNDPGAKYVYSNSNFILLGMILQKAGKDTPYYQLLQKYILSEVALPNTVWPNLNAMPSPYIDGFSGKKDVTGYSPSWCFTAGELITTAGDLSTWIRALCNSPLLSTDSQNQLLTWTKVPGNTGPGYHDLSGIFYSQGWLGHNGSLAGYNTACYYNRDLDASVVVMVNTNTVNPDGAERVNGVCQMISSTLFPGHTFQPGSQELTP